MSRFFCTADEFPSIIFNFLFKHYKYARSFHSMYFRVELDGDLIHIREDNNSDYGVLLSTQNAIENKVTIAIIAKKWATKRLEDIYAK